MLLTAPVKATLSLLEMPYSFVLTSIELSQELESDV